jgi:hypothetical protein
MSWSHWRIAGLLGAVLLGQPILDPADGQTTSVTVEGPSRPQPDENLPADFIDSRPILAYFDDRPMPDTVRGLLQELRRPDACGKAAQLRTAEVCALVFYKLDDDFTPDRLRPPLIMRAIYRVTDPEDPADTVMLMPDQIGDLQRYADGDLFEPLRDVRANICQRTDLMSVECRGTRNRGVLYRPFGILGKLENDREGILPARSANKHFVLDAASLDRDWMTRQQIRGLCMQVFSVRAPSLLAC